MAFQDGKTSQNSQAAKNVQTNEGQIIRGEMKMPIKPRTTEVDAYIFIKKNLKTLGWDTRNPARTQGGQVYTQNECLADSEIGNFLGLTRPENIVKVNETTLWVIEAKRSHSQLVQALTEAKGYARKLNRSNRLSAFFVSGVAGNELDTFLIRTCYFNGAEFVPVKLNGVEATGLLTPEQTRLILDTGRTDLTTPTLDERLFLSRANLINEELHLGAVNPHQRAGVMAALLLAMLSDTSPNIQERDPATLIGDINNRALNVLRQQGKSEFYDYIRVALPTTSDNHVKFRQALVTTIQELNNLNIRSAMNSGADWLGSFYEVFLKYASWAQDLGIVLTPRHLTRYIAHVLDVRFNDILYDPTCGTGGFLVAAFDYVKEHGNADQLNRFKQHGVFGVEQDAGVAALAVVNMIFRGDGKNNILEGNCLVRSLLPHTVDGIQTAQFATEGTDLPPVTKVMMNPPFALKRSDEKEFKFVDQALGQMEDGGLLFSVLPYSAMVRPGVYHTWRKYSLLPNHTLLAVVTLPPDLFYPVGVTTVGVVIKKGIPHPRKQSVLWVRAITDGLEISKKRRLPSSRTSNDLMEVKDTIQAFLNNPSLRVKSVPQVQKATPIDFTDQQLEIVPEVYLEERPPTDDEILKGLEDSVREVFAYLVKINRATIHSGLLEATNPVRIAASSWQEFNVTELFDLKRGNFHSIKALDPGSTPTISRVGKDNGFVGYYERPDDAIVWPPTTITVSTVTGDTFVQPVDCIITDNVVVCVPKEQDNNTALPLETLFFIQYMLNRGKWRYSYGRQCYKTKYARTNVRLPVSADGSPDHECMASFVQTSRYWPLVQAVFTQGSRILSSNGFDAGTSKPIK